MRTPLRLLLPLVLASACASANAPAPQSEVLTMDENGALIRHTVDENARASVAATPDRIWQALLAYILPLSPLTPGTSYTVQLAGTSGGAAFSKVFSFTTN